MPLLLIENIPLTPGNGDCIILELPVDALNAKAHASAWAGVAKMKHNVANKGRMRQEPRMMAILVGFQL
jgi:hypothetical protein